MTSAPSRARLLNSEHELIAEGVCVLDEPAGQASLEVERTAAAVQGQHGHLSLELDSGRSLLVSDKPMLMTITPPGQRPTPENRRRIYRLRLIDPMAFLKEQGTNLTQDASPSSNNGAAAAGTMPALGSRFSSTNLTQDASAVGAAGKGRPAVSRMGRLFAEGRGETPAAR
jgi:hypothetical protein